MKHDSRLKKLEKHFNPELTEYIIIESWNPYGDVSHEDYNKHVEELKLTGKVYTVNHDYEEHKRIMATAAERERNWTPEQKRQQAEMDEWNRQARIKAEESITKE